MNLTRVIVPNWMPTKLTVSTIKTEFLEIVAPHLPVTLREFHSHGINSWSDRAGPYKGVRLQIERKSPDYEGLWHWDCSGHARFVVTWSDSHSTEVRFPNYRLFQASDRAIVLIDNQQVEHRRPRRDFEYWFVCLTIY